MVIGDQGGSSDATPTTPPQLRIAQSMGSVAQSLHAQFVLGVGDNFYGNGITAANQFRFQASFEDASSKMCMSRQACKLNGG